MRFRPPWALVLFFLMGLATFVVGGWTVYRNELFKGEVERTMGQVDELKHASGRKSGNKATYHYTDRAGVVHGGHTAVAPEAWRYLKKKGGVPIKYLPESPDLSRLDLQQQSDWEGWQALIPTGVGALFMGVGFLVMYTQRKSQLEQATPKPPYMR